MIEMNLETDERAAHAALDKARELNAPSGGAVPVLRDHRVIGAIGCGGGTPEQDHQCAMGSAGAAG